MGIFTINDKAVDKALLDSILVWAYHEQNGWPKPYASDVDTLYNGQHLSYWPRIKGGKIVSTKKTGTFKIHVSDKIPLPIGNTFKDFYIFCESEELDLANLPGRVSNLVVVGDIKRIYNSNPRHFYDCACMTIYCNVDCEIDLPKTQFGTIIVNTQKSRVNFIAHICEWAYTSIGKGFRMRIYHEQNGKYRSGMIRANYDFPLKDRSVTFNGTPFNNDSRYF